MVKNDERSDDVFIWWRMGDTMLRDPLDDAEDDCCWYIAIMSMSEVEMHSASSSNIRILLPLAQEARFSFIAVSLV